MKIGDVVVCSYSALVEEITAAIAPPLAQALDTAKICLEVASAQKAIAGQMHADNLSLRRALALLLEDTQHLHHKCSDDDCPVKIARRALAGPVKQ